MYGCTPGLSLTGHVLSLIRVAINLMGSITRVSAPGELLFVAFFRVVIVMKHCASLVQQIGVRSLHGVLDTNYVNIIAYSLTLLL